MKLYTTISFLLLLFSYSAFSQLDSNKIFLKQKGSLPYPISKYSVQEPGNEYPCNCIVLQADSSSKVKAIFDGLVVAVREIEDMFVIITKYGDYFITYAGLTKPAVKEADWIRSGQELSTIKKFDANYELTLYISDREQNFNPKEWIIR